MTADREPSQGVELETLASDATGSWLITTQASSYLLDLTAGTATRIPGTGTDTTAAPVAELRRDAEAVPLLQVSCTIGQPMLLMLDLRGDGIVTARTTTDVTRIEPWPRLPSGAEVVWASVLGGFYDAEQVRALLSAAGQAVDDAALVERRDLLTLTTGSGQRVFPASQFRGGRPLPGLDKVLASLPESLVSRWTVASWLVSPQPELDGERPVDALAGGDVLSVLKAAKHWAAALAE